MALQPLGLTSKIVAYNNEVDLKDKTAAPKMQGATVAEILALGPDALVNGKSSVYVAGVGTPAENGAELINGYTSAVAKIQNIASVTSASINFDQNLGSGGYRIFANPNTFVGYTASTNYTATYGTIPAQTLIWRIRTGGSSDMIEVDITDTSGNPQSSLTIDTSGIPVLASQTIPAHLIIGAGEYELPSDLVINNLVSVVSLTGQRDVNITGSDVQVSSGANAKSTIVAGLNLQSNKFIVDTNLSQITVKNVEARGSGSFDSASGGGSLSGTFIDCFSGSESFASSSGANASGTFIRCDAKRPSNTGGFSFGSNSGSTSGYFESCGSLTGNNDSGGGYANFGRSGQNTGGYFYYCKGQSQSFASSASQTNARFTNCQSTGGNSFGSNSGSNSGIYNFCISGAGSFGSSPQNYANTTNAKYHYCIADGEENFGTHLGGSGSAKSTYIGCISGGNSFGLAPFGTSVTDGKLYNCQVTAGTFAAVGATGKVRNSLDSTFTIINLG
tara:strand:+ start:65 stop:1573 length:1509 start_codon:yes stop_codon:yes gene_type:complete